MIKNGRVIFIQPAQGQLGHHVYSTNAYGRVYGGSIWKPRLLFSNKYLKISYGLVWLFYKLFISLIISKINKNITFVLLDYDIRQSFILLLLAHGNLFVNTTELYSASKYKLKILRKIQNRALLYCHSKKCIQYYNKHQINNVCHWPSPSLTISDIIETSEKLDFLDSFQILTARHMTCNDLKTLINKYKVKNNLVVLCRSDDILKLKKLFPLIKFHGYISEKYLLFLISKCSSVIIPYSNKVIGESAFAQLAAAYSKPIFFIDKKYFFYNSFDYKKKYILRLND